MSSMCRYAARRSPPRNPGRDGHRGPRYGRIASAPGGSGWRRMAGRRNLTPQWGWMRYRLGTSRSAQHRGQRPLVPRHRRASAHEDQSYCLTVMALVDRAFLDVCVDAVDGAALGEGAFAPGPAVWVGKREVAHIDSDDVLDIRLTRDVIRSERAALKADPRVTLRRSSSDWLEFAVSSEDDLVAAGDLVARAVSANLASAPEGPPPSGPDLERRRRFH